jgi:hypothetical protein
MSEPTSTSSPRAGSISDDGFFAFDGAEALLRAWGGGLKPDPLLTVSDWAARYRMLSSRAAAEPGRYRTRRTPYMKEIVDALSPGHPAQRIVFMKAAQVGAPLVVDTPIPTPFGWSTMGDLVPGDLLYDDQGQVCSVTGVSEVMTGRGCYEIVFDDCERVTCDAEHRWPVWDFTNDVAVRKVLKTEEMTSRVRIGNSMRNRYAIDCCRPVEMPEQDLIINPYVLGMWLGDGSSILNHISVHEDDREVADYLCACGVEAEFRLPSWRCGKIANIVIDPALRRAPASARRSLPACACSTCSATSACPTSTCGRAGRSGLELVPGFMDSDGSIATCGKRCELSNSDPKLIESFVELLRSLGYKPASISGPGGARCSARIAGVRTPS